MNTIRISILKKLLVVVALNFAMSGISSADTVPQVTEQLNFAAGWNLMGNSLNTTINVASTFGDSTKFVTIWKWDSKNKAWDMYAPSLSTSALASYCASHYYQVLSSIGPGEGYWVNAAQAVTLQQTGPGFYVGGTSLISGWNLTATADNVYPDAFNTSLSTPAANYPPNFVTLWAWDSATTKWLFYAPSKDADGSLSSYISSMGYEDFKAAKATVGPGRGIWVNANAIASPTQSYYYVNSSTSVTYTGSVNGVNNDTLGVPSNVFSKIKFVANGPIQNGAAITSIQESYAKSYDPNNYLYGYLCDAAGDSNPSGCPINITNYGNFTFLDYTGETPGQNFFMEFAQQQQFSYNTISVSSYTLKVYYDYPNKFYPSTTSTVPTPGVN